jgi:hypothetical protein
MRKARTALKMVATLLQHKYQQLIDLQTQTSQSSFWQRTLCPPSVRNHLFKME